MTPPKGIVPQPIQLEAPADEVAGGPVDKGRGGDQDHRVAVQIAVKLEIILKMYKRLLQLEVGTGLIESEAMGIVYERLVGPTGHASLIDEDIMDPGQDKCQTETELKLRKTRVRDTAECCWRDKQLVRKLVQIRIDSVKPQWKKAKAMLSQKMRDLATVCTREEMKVK